MITPNCETGGIRLNQDWFSSSAKRRREHHQTLVAAGRLEAIPDKPKTGLTGILYLGAMVSRYVEVDPIVGKTVDGVDLADRDDEQSSQAARWEMGPRIGESGYIEIRIGRPELLIEDLERRPVYFGHYPNRLSKGPAQNLAALIRNEMVQQQVNTVVET